MPPRTFLVGLALVVPAFASHDEVRPMTTRTFLIVDGAGPAWPWQNAKGLPPFATVDQPPVDRGHTSLSLVGVGPGGEVRWHLKIDTGEGGFQTAHRAGLPPPDLILVTHGHPDHLNRMQLDHFARAARPRRIHGQTNAGLLPATIATASARHIERHRDHVADLNEFNIAPFFNYLARDFVTENQAGRSCRATTHHMLIAATDIRRHDFEDDAVFSLALFVRVDQFRIRNALDFDFAWPQISHAAIRCHCFCLLSC